MSPSFLVPEEVRREDGTSEPIAIGAAKGATLLLTLGISRIIEQESLDVSVWGSADGKDWGSKPLASFPQKFYCGTYSILLDLSGSPDTDRLQVRWKMNRWGRGEPKPLFGFYLFGEQVPAEVLAGASVAAG